MHNIVHSARPILPNPHSSNAFVVRCVVQRISHNFIPTPRFHQAQSLAHRSSRIEESKERTMSEESDAKKQKMASKTEDTKSTPVTIVLNGASYKTTKETLLGRDDNSFFHLQFSGRWKHSNVLEIHDRCGETFFDVLYYLRFGDVPRNPSTREPLLSSEQLEKLKEEAGFYLHPGLEKICTPDCGSCPLFVVTYFNCDSSKRLHVQVTQFVSYEKAREYYDTHTEHMVQEVWQIDEGDFYTNERSVDDETGLEELSIWCDGNFKRPYGYSLKIWHNNDQEIRQRDQQRGVCKQHDVRAWPDVYDYGW